jgi:hypothetical protein
MAIKVEHRIGIATPVDNAYEIIADLENWPSWSPIHKKVSGRLSFGAPVELIEHYDGLGTWEQTGSIADWTPLSHIHMHIPRPMFVGTLTRYFEFEILAETGCAFTVGALFKGFVSEREGKRYRPFLREGFKAMAEALKAKAEAEYDPSVPPPHLPPVDAYKSAPKPKSYKLKTPKFFGDFSKKK